MRLRKGLVQTIAYFDGLLSGAGSPSLPLAMPSDMILPLAPSPINRLGA